MKKNKREIKRWDIPNKVFIPSKYGKWCLFSDVEPLLSDLEAMENKLEEAIELLSDVHTRYQNDRWNENIYHSSTQSRSNNNGMV